jgi:hypothetical protein
MQNLSEWKTGGYAAWLEGRRLREIRLNEYRGQGPIAFGKKSICCQRQTNLNFEVETPRRAVATGPNARIGGFAPATTAPAFHLDAARLADATKATLRHHLR